MAHIHTSWCSVAYLISPGEEGKRSRTGTTKWLSKPLPTTTTGRQFYSGCENTTWSTFRDDLFMVYLGLISTTLFRRGIAKQRKLKIPVSENALFAATVLWLTSHIHTTSIHTCIHTTWYPVAYLLYLISRGKRRGSRTGTDNEMVAENPPDDDDDDGAAVMHNLEKVDVKYNQPWFCFRVPRRLGYSILYFVV